MRRPKLVDSEREYRVIQVLPLETFVELVLVYVAVGAVLFALIPGQAMPSDFHWRNQANAFRDSVPEVLAWPLMLWRVCGLGRFLD